MKPPLLALCAMAVVSVIGGILFHRSHARLKAEFAASTDESVRLRNLLTAADQRQTGMQERVASLESELGSTRNQVAVAQARAQQLERELGAAHTQLAEAAETLRATEQSADDIRRELALAKLNAPPFSLDEVESLQSTVAELEAQVAALTPASNGSAGPGAGRLSAGIPVTVLSVGPENAFVVLDYGAEHGARPAQHLHVRRGTDPVATVHITEIRDRFSIAHVQPESLRSGLRKGDTASIPVLP